jgi:hypothetical protein
LEELSPGLTSFEAFVRRSDNLSFFDSHHPATDKDV